MPILIISDKLTGEILEKSVRYPMDDKIAAELKQLYEAKLGAALDVTVIDDTDKEQRLSSGDEFDIVKDKDGAITDLDFSKEDNKNTLEITSNKSFIAKGEIAEIQFLWLDKAAAIHSLSSGIIYVPISGPDGSYRVKVTIKEGNFLYNFTPDKPGVYTFGAGKSKDFLITKSCTIEVYEVL